MAFIKRYSTKNGGTVIQVVYKHGRQVVKTIHIGTAHTEDDLDVLIAIAKGIIRGTQQQMDLFPSKPDAVEMVMERAYPKLLWDVLCSIYCHIGFGILADDVFRQLVIARLIEPVSKLDTIRVLSDIGQDMPSNAEIHRCLRRVVAADYRSAVSFCCFEHASTHALSLLLYDVTTLYFEIQNEDDFRKAGMSKERRLEPQIIIGLLVGRDGFPLEIQSFEGNRAEVKTIMKVLDTFKNRYGLDEITVTADAAMLSSENIQALENMGYHYIIGSRLAKTPYEITEYIKDPGIELSDGQIFDTKQQMNLVKGSKRVARRVIYQYRKDRAGLDLRNIDKLVYKAQNMIDGKAEYKRNRFLKIIDSAKEINHALVAESRLKAGIKGYITDLDIPAQEVIDAYHQLFQVEHSFRMSKTDLKARPVFHHKKDSIEAHLSIVFTALAIARYIEIKTKMSIRRFIKTIRPIQTGVVCINGKSRIIEPLVSIDVKKLLKLLETDGGS